MKTIIDIHTLFYCNGLLEGEWRNYILKSDGDVNIPRIVYEKQINLLTKIYKNL